MQRPAQLAPTANDGRHADAYEYANLDWSQFGRELRGAPADSAGSLSIFGALEQELALRLEPRKDRVEMTVIDRADKPSED